MPLILSGNVASAIGGAYEVANSCRFDGSSAYMTKTPGSAGSQVTQTYSVWVKRSKLGDEEFIMYARKDADDDTRLYFENDTLRFQCTVDNTTHTRLWTNRVFRDPSAWYHIVISYDSSVSTPSTSSVQMFINGVKETSFSSATYPSQNDVSYWCDDALHTVGRRSDGTSNYYNGYMAEAVLIDGSALTASSFGEFDEDSPTIWKPKDVSGLTFGTNGFYLDFEDSANLGNDANGGTDFSESGLAATDQTTDTPTNNFATFNPLLNNWTGMSEGNTKVINTSQAYRDTFSTIALKSGKWYVECRIDTEVGGTYPIFGIADASEYQKPAQHNLLGRSALGWGFQTDGNYYNNNSDAGDWSTLDSGDIIGLYLDLDSSQNTLKVYKNGSSELSLDINDPVDGYYFGVSTYQEDSVSGSINFGNPNFSLSSAVSDDNGYGSFEYSPNISTTKYYAICTKNLAEYGG